MGRAAAEGEFHRSPFGAFIEGCLDLRAIPCVAGADLHLVDGQAGVLTKQSFFEGIKYAKAGHHLHEISAAIGAYAESFGYGVVRDLVGHGIGTHLHEDPAVPNFAQPSRGVRLQPGMTLAIEPMITAGGYAVRWLDDDWTVVTEDGSLAAHYENTILITEGEPEILTLSHTEEDL